MPMIITGPLPLARLSGSDRDELLPVGADVRGTLVCRACVDGYLFDPPLTVDQFCQGCAANILELTRGPSTPLGRWWRRTHTYWRLCAHMWLFYLAKKLEETE